MDRLAHWGFRPPEVIALERAFAGHLDAVHFAQAAEVLQKRAVGQTGGKAAIVLPEQVAGEVAAQGAAAVELVVLLGAGADLFALGKPALEIALQEAGFQAAVNQELINEQELVAELAVIDIALDGGQDLRQRGLEWNNDGVRHGARLYSSLWKSNPF